jgi:hypothetical protein
MAEKSPSSPQNGDVVIWELDPPSNVPTYMVKVEGSGSAPDFPAGRNIWSKAYARAKELAGPGHKVWKREPSGSFHRIV